MLGLLSPGNNFGQTSGEREEIYTGARKLSTTHNNHKCTLHHEALNSITEVILLTKHRYFQYHAFEY